MALWNFLFVGSVVNQLVGAIDNGLGITPPMGWRSWNCYHKNITQPRIQMVIDAIVDRSRKVDGKSMSYYDLGYTEVGVDDNWQFCMRNGSAYGSNSGKYWHTEAAPNGKPIINTERFPDLKGLVSYAHSKKVGLGWYFNNCLCKEDNGYPANEVNDVAFLREYEFDGVKLDGCASSHNISNWQHLINNTGTKPMLTENCHNRPNDATLDWCPMNFFRTSGDINGDYTSIIGRNLQSVIPYLKYPGPAITRPGCFAYPDMLEVGNIPQQMNFPNVSVHSMDRTHFAAWVVVSSPLIMGYDITDSSITDRVWDILTNTEAIAVSQTWAGHPGTLLKQSEEKNYYAYPVHIKNQILMDNGKYPHSAVVQAESAGGVEMNKWQIWGKPQPDGAWAILLMNNDGNTVQDLTVEFKDIPGMVASRVKVRSIWDRKDLGQFDGKYTAKGVLPFDSEFLMVTPVGTRLMFD